MRSATRRSIECIASHQVRGRIPTERRRRYDCYTNSRGIEWTGIGRRSSRAAAGMPMEGSVQCSAEFGLDLETPMFTRQTSSTTLRRSVTSVVRFFLLVVAILGASVGVVLWSTEPVQVARSGAIAPRRASPATGEATTRPASVPAAQLTIPLYSEDWTEDSGQGLAARYSLPITDPKSLEQIRTSDAGRGQRGIDRMRHDL